MIERVGAPRLTAARGEDGAHGLEVLVRRAGAGDVQAFATLAAGHQVALERFARRLMGDPDRGEDLVQETLLRAQQSIARLGAPYRFGPWLMSIAANLARKAWRAESRRPLSLEWLSSAYPNVAWDEADTSIPTPEQTTEAAEEARLLAEAIAALPPSLSRVVVLHYLDGLDYAQVARSLDLPVSTVKGRLFASRTRLRRQLAASGLHRGSRPQPNRKGAPHAMSPPSPTPQTPQTPQTPSTPPVSRVAPSRDAGSHNLHVQVRLDPLVDEALRFITLPWPRTRPEEALGDLGSPRNRYIPLVVLEQMVLDGVSQRQDVVDFLSATFDPEQFDIR
jgi:RNA polymerase sigma-70 factor (ECF subfamily)